jgi:hypothetical protein
MKKTDKEAKGTRRLRFSSETVRELRTTELQQVAGGTDEGVDNTKRPV